ncbi:hypothetical protein L9F63_003055, partial [Diploptera punctata]
SHMTYPFGDTAYRTLFRCPQSTIYRGNDAFTKKKYTQTVRENDAILFVTLSENLLKILHWKDISIDFCMFEYGAYDVPLDDYNQLSMLSQSIEIRVIMEVADSLIIQAVHRRMIDKLNNNFKFRL